MTFDLLRGLLQSVDKGELDACPQEMHPVRTVHIILGYTKIIINLYAIIMFYYVS